MGGKGSGRTAGWGRTKLASCVCLSARDVATLVRKEEGWLHPCRSGNRSFELMTHVVPEGNNPSVIVCLREDGDALWCQVVPLDHVPTEFGGLRWWMRCPLTPKGKTCDRRVGKLYLPGFDLLFGCRKCHELAY